MNKTLRVAHPCNVQLWTRDLGRISTTLDFYVLMAPWLTISYLYSVPEQRAEYKVRGQTQQLEKFNWWYLLICLYRTNILGLGELICINYIMSNSRSEKKIHKKQKISQFCRFLFVSIVSTVVSSQCSTNSLDFLQWSECQLYISSITEEISSCFPRNKLKFYNLSGNPWQ